GRAWAGRGPLSSVVAVVAVLIHLHAQFLDLAGQGVTAPAPQYGGIPAPAGTVLEGGFYHDPLEDGYRLIQQVADTAGQLLVGPVAQPLFPVVGGGAGVRLVEQLRRKVVRQHLATGGHDRDPAAGVPQLAHVARPW